MTCIDTHEQLVRSLRRIGFLTVVVLIALARVLG